MHVPRVVCVGLFRHPLELLHHVNILCSTSEGVDAAFRLANLPFLWADIGIVTIVTTLETEDCHILLVVFWVFC